MLLDTLKECFKEIFYNPFICFTCRNYKDCKNYNKINNMSKTIKYEISVIISSNNFITIKRISEQIKELLLNDVIDIDFKVSVKLFLTKIKSLQ